MHSSFMTGTFCHPCAQCPARSHRMGCHAHQSQHPLPACLLHPCSSTGTGDSPVRSTGALQLCQSVVHTAQTPAQPQVYSLECCMRCSTVLEMHRPAMCATSAGHQSSMQTQARLHQCLYQSTEATVQTLEVQQDTLTAVLTGSVRKTQALGVSDKAPIQQSTCFGPGPNRKNTSSTPLSASQLLLTPSASWETSMYSSAELSLQAEGGPCSPGTLAPLTHNLLSRQPKRSTGTSAAPVLACEMHGTSALSVRTTDTTWAFHAWALSSSLTQCSGMHQRVHSGI